MESLGETRYAITEDGFHIGYKVFGQGEPVHVFLPELISVDSLGQHPAHIRLGRFMGSLSRCVVFDPRGLGVSDPVAPDRVGVLDDWVCDVVAVLDAVGAERVVFTGCETNSAHLAIRFAVSHPDRILRLSLANAHARALVAPDYPVGVLSMDDVDGFVDALGRDWGTGAVFAQAAPNLVSDSSFLELCGRIERQTCSPGTAEAIARAALVSDVRALLPQVSCPTLVYYTGDIAYISREQSRYLAEHIPGAMFIEAPGRSFYQPDEIGQLGAWAEFILGRAPQSIERRLATILFVDVVASTAHAAAIGDEQWAATLEDLDTWVTREVRTQGGRRIKQTGDGQLATFDTPTGALSAARSIANGAHVLGVEVRCGLHVGEIEVRPDEDIAGIAVNVAARVLDTGRARDVIATRTVVDLARGSGFEFAERGAHELQGVSGVWDLYELKS
jgi:class 3 adenylate cyclase/pimeloyl-ACP methyl ester carboxylesterase